MDLMRVFFFKDGMGARAIESWVTVVEWGRMKLDWLRRWLPFARGIASHDTFGRVFSLLDAKGFEACFVGWMQQLCPALQGQLVSIDGKSMRGSHEAGLGMTHLVSAWHHGAGRECQYFCV